MLFADLVGYTTLSEERDPETVKRIVDGAFERLAADVRNHGGRVDKIVGDAIVALFGAPLAHEDDAERAVRSGLAMLSTLEEYGAEVDLPMQMRVGVNTGEVLVGALRAGGDYTAMGDVVNLASRIQTMADPGEVMVGAATHAATRDAISYDPRGEVTAKGRSRDETVWVATGALRAPGPEHSSADAPLFGRETEMDLLVNATAGSIRHLRGQVVLLIGEAGVGKSRLASELGESLKASHGVRCYSGRCVPYGEANPWWPVAEILRGALEVSAGESAQKVERSTRAAVSAALESEPAEVEVVVEGLLHILGHEGTFDGMEGAAARAEAARALRTYLEALLAQGPLLVRISDLHWADDAILSLIDDLAENLARLPITLVATARRSLLSRWSPSPGRFNSLLLNVDPLDRSAVRQLLEHLAESPVDAGEADQLLDRSGGNPFYLEELVTLVQSGEAAVATSANGESDTALALPETLRGVVAARVDALTAEEQDVLGEAAIWGAEGSVGVLERIAQVSRGVPSVMPQIQSLSDKDVLVLDGGQWAFRSDLVREVTYARLTKSARLHGHAGIADYMDRLNSSTTADDPTVEVVARHYAEAAELATEVGSPDAVTRLSERAIHWLGESALRAERGGAFSFGARMNRRILGLVHDGEMGRVPALLGLSRCLAELWESDGAARAATRGLAIAREAGSDALEGEALLALAVAEMRRGAWERCDELLEAALEVQQRRSETAAVGEIYRQMALSSLLRGDHRAAEAPVSLALEAFSEVGDRRGEGWALQSLAWIAFGDARLDEAETYIAWSASALEEVSDRGGLLWTRGLEAFVRFAKGDFEEASVIAGEVLEGAQRRGDRFGIGMMNMAQGGVELWSGHPAAAVTSAESALENLDERTDVVGMEQALSLHGRALAITGRVDAGLASLERALELGAGTSMGLSVTVALLTEVQLGLPGRVLRAVPAEGSDAVRALWWLQADDPDPARALLGPEGELTATGGPGDRIAAAIVAAALGVAVDLVGVLESVRSDPASTYNDHAQALVVGALIDRGPRGSELIAEARSVISGTEDRVAPVLVDLADAVRGGPDSTTTMAGADASLASVGLGATTWRQVFTSIAGARVT